MSALPTSWVEKAGDGDHRIAPGLYLRVRGDSRCWVLRFTSPTRGKRREMGLGQASQVSEFEACKSAQTAWDQVGRGIDPIDDRDATRETRKVADLRAKAITVRRAMHLWLDYEEPRRKWSRKHIQDVERSIDLHPPQWFRDLPITDLDSGCVIRALEQMTCSDEYKDRFRQRVSWCQEWLIEQGRLDRNAGGVLRIVRGRFESL